KADVLLEAFLDLSEQAARAASEDPQPQGIPDTGVVAADLKAVLRATVDELHDPTFEAPSRARAAEGVVNEALGLGFVSPLPRPPPAHRPGTLRRPARPALAPVHRPDQPRVHRHPRRLRALRPRPALPPPPAAPGRSATPASPGRSATPARDPRDAGRRGRRPAGPRARVGRA